MTWADLGQYVFNFVVLIAAIMFIASIIGELSTSDYRRRLCDWQEGQIRDLNRDIMWLKQDLRWERCRRESAEKLYEERTELLYHVLKNGTEPEGGSSAHIAA